MIKKRLFAFLLAGSMLLAVGCDNKKPEESPNESSLDESETSEQPLTPDEIKELRAKWDSYYSETDSVRKGEFVNHVIGRPYTVSIDASSEYPDPDTKKLTDGNFARTTFSGGEKTNWVGYKPGGRTFTIELDLGEVKKDITDIGVSFCKDTGPGIGLPISLNIYTAIGDEDYKLLGTLYSPIGGSTNMIHRATLLPEKTIEVQRVKFEIVRPTSTWLFIDELIVANYVEDEIEGDFYGDFNIKEITTPELWESSESDYNNVINLAQGRPYQIRSGLELEKSQQDPSINTSPDENFLTDGKFSTSSYYTNPAWFRFTRSVDREVVIDLGKTGAVDGFSIGFLRDPSTGITIPSNIEFSVSENGKDWEKISSYEDMKSSDKNEIIRLKETLDTSVRARYFKVLFTVSPHTWIDEITVDGKKNITNAREVKPDKIDDIKYPNRFVTPDDIGGTSDIFLSYTNPGSTPISKDVFLPHVGYIVDNEIKDTLFDSFLFLPSVSFLYEKNSQGQNVKRPLKKSDWEDYINNQFVDGLNLDALNDAVGEVKEALGDDDYKVSIFFSILYPVSTQKSFGEIGGKNLDFSNIEDRKIAIQWLVDEHIKLFNEKGYEHLYLQGFYWFTEEINYNDNGIKEVINFTTDYVRSQDYITTWIPYHHASGFNDWQELGFDFVCYQPNYAFDHTVPIQRIYDAAEIAKRLGMCVEIEVGTASAADISRLKAYYYVGAEVGFMKDTVHMYYQGGVPGVIYQAYISTDPFVNSAYEDTYNFIKGKFSAGSKNFDDLHIEGKGVAQGSIEIKADNYAYGLIVTKSPRYGSVKLKADGEIEYIPYDNLTGEDSFTVVVDYGYTQSEPINITVEIK